MDDKNAVSHATLHAIHHCANAQAITRKHEWPHIKMMTISYGGALVHSMVMTHLSFVCILNALLQFTLKHTMMRSFASRHGNTYVALLHTHTHVHTRALHYTLSFRTQCELPSATTEVHSRAHPTYACTLWYPGHTITITWRYPHRCRSHM